MTSNDFATIELRQLLAELAEIEPDFDWVSRARNIAGVPWNQLTEEGARFVLRALTEHVSETQR